MIEIEEQMITFQTCYNTLRKDFEEQKYDLHLIKSHANTLLDEVSNFKINKNLIFTKVNQEELVKLLSKIKNLIHAIDKELDMQAKEEYYTSIKIEI